MSMLNLPPIIADMVETMRNPKASPNHKENIFGRMLDISRVLNEEIERHKASSFTKTIARKR